MEPTVATNKGETPAVCIVTLKEGAQHICKREKSQVMQSKAQ